MAVYGVDGCRRGWFYVRADGARFDFGVVTQLSELIDNAPDGSTVLVDIPIGLRDDIGGPRQCDLVARKLLGQPRGSSVFPAPIRAILTEPSHKLATAKSKALTGKGISQQAFGIMPKIKEVDDLLASDPRAKKMVRELHPELCFWALNLRQAMVHSKKKSPGHRERLAVLARVLPQSADLYADAVKRYLRREVARDDILDALIALVTAIQPDDKIFTAPDQPERDSRGLAMEIVYAVMEA